MSEIRIEDWSVVVSRDDMYLPPEQCGRINGAAYNHPEFSDGSRVVTSLIMEASGREVKTASGSVYRLGEPKAEYLDYLAKNGFRYDPEQPIKVRRPGEE